MNEPEHHKICRVVGARIKENRRKANISQLDLAELAQLHPSIIGKIERGVSNPKLDTLARIALALDTTVSELVQDITADLVQPKARLRVSAKDLLEARKAASGE